MVGNKARGGHRQDDCKIKGEEQASYTTAPSPFMVEIIIPVRVTIHIAHV